MRFLNYHFLKYKLNGYRFFYTYYLIPNTYY
jgi:hypothetical protein